ncbi:conserved hypothetical protein [Xanthomonas oryzae pv. oryzae MAFF 311018]|nr:conserved hypothetical protein [Xanthomonas oryzae pv. oryzae MAFF 311018]
MKAFQIGNQTGLESLVVAEMFEPVAGPGQVIVAPRLVGLINRDLQILKGTYAGKLVETRVPVAEGVGIVTSVGAGVSDVAPGDRVVSGHFPAWLDGRFRAEMFAHDLGVTHDGWLAETVVLPASALIKVPVSLDDQDVAALASAAVTAWHAGSRQDQGRRPSALSGNRRRLDGRARTRQAPRCPCRHHLIQRREA